MTRLKTNFIAAVCVAVAGLVSTSAANAVSYAATNGMRVTDASGGRFEVSQLAGKGPSDYWCAAGEYVIQYLRMSPSTRIYLDQPLGPGKLGIGNTAGYTVSLDASLTAIVEGLSQGLSMSTKKVGDNWTAAHGQSQCQVGRDRFR